MNPNRSNDAKYREAASPRGSGVIARHSLAGSIFSGPVAVALALGLAIAAHANDTGQPLRVGTSGDYAPFSFHLLDAPIDGGAAGRPFAADLAGFDIAVARAYAADRGRELEFVPFVWPELTRALRDGAFEVAMSGITVRAERAVLGRFSLPVAHSGAVLLSEHAGSDAGRFDRPGKRIAVNAGGHLERVTRSTFARAEVIAVPDNAAVLDELLEGRADAVVTDTQEAPHWLARRPSLQATKPFTSDAKAYLVSTERRELRRDLDAWLLAREADGTLARLRWRYLDDRNDETSPSERLLGATLDVLALRLSLMPFVARYKAANELPVEAPERERAVIDAALASVARAAREAGLPPPPVERSRALYRAQIEAAKALQHEVLAGPSRGGPPPFDLASELRPALVDIGDQLATLLVRLPGTLPPDNARAETLLRLARSGLPAEHARAIADALAAHCTAERGDEQAQ